MTIDSFLAQLSEHCGIPSEQTTITLNEVDDRLEIQLTIPEEDSGRMIGYHGEALEAIQRVLRIAFEQQHPDKKIILNINDYRERRLAQLHEKVARICEQVLSDGQPYTFTNFVPAHERYAIHTALATLPDGEKLESFSHGDGTARRLTIALKSDHKAESAVAEKRSELEKQPEVENSDDVASSN